MEIIKAHFKFLRNSAILMLLILLIVVAEKQDKKKCVEINAPLLRSVVTWYENNYERGSRIKLEEEEITLFDGQTKLKSIYVSARSKENRAIHKKIEQLICKKLGIQNLQEIRLHYTDNEIKKQNEGVWNQYKNWYKKILKVRKLQERRLTFYNKANKPIKTISIMQEIVYENRLAKLSNSKIPNSIKKLINKNAIVSGNGKYALLIFNKGEIASIIGNLEEISFGEGAKVSSEVQLINIVGNIVWQKEFKNFSIDVNYFFVSDNGNVAILRDYTLLVYDKNGEEILTLPNNHQDAYISRLSFMSPNGRYLIADGVLRPRKKGTTIFIDLEDKTYWQSPERYAIAANDDDNKVNEGIFRVGYMDGARGSFIMDVKEKLK